MTALAFPAAAGAATVDVDIKDFEYQPASITIAVQRGRSLIIGDD